MGRGNQEKSRGEGSAWEAGKVSGKQFYQRVGKREK